MLFSGQDFQESTAASRSSSRMALGFTMMAGAILASGSLVSAKAGEEREMPWRWSRISSDEGLPQDGVAAITQSPDGYLWFGTQAGLARFDGIQFKVFDQAHDSSFHGNRIQALRLASNGEVWVGFHGNEALRLQGTQAFPLADDWDVVDDLTRWIREDPKGGMWLGGRYLKHFDLSGNSRPNELARAAATVSMHSPLLDGDGLLWLADGALVRVLDTASEGATVAEYELPMGEVGFIDQTPSGVIWAAGQGRLAAQRDDHWVELGRDGEATGEITCSWTDRRGAYWIGASRGLFRCFEVRGDSDELLRLRFERVADRELTGETGVRSIFEDREGSLWVGTHADGLLQGRPMSFDCIPLPAKGLTRGPFYVETADGGVWYCVYKGLKRWEQGAWVPVEGLKGELDVDRLAASRDGLWMTFQDSRVTHYRAETIETFQHDLGEIEALREGSDGRLWVATKDRVGVFEQGRLETVVDLDRLRTLPKRMLRLFETQDGVMWLDAFGTLIRCTEEPWTLELPSSEVRGLHRSASGDLWISTYGAGLLRYREDVSQVTQGASQLSAISTENGLPDNALGTMLEGRDGALWINSNHGVVRVELDNLDAVADGDECWVEAHLCHTGEGNGVMGGETRDGRLWFPSVSNIVILDPAEQRINTVAPLPVIEGVIADEVPVELSASVVLSPGVEDLAFSYSAPSFVDPRRVRFRFMLDGFDPDWIEAGELRDVRYSKLPPGDYTFRVMAGNEDGVWSSKVAEMPFRLEPSFYQTWWFFWLCLAGAGATIYLAHALRIRALRRHNKRLLDEIARRRSAEEGLRLGEERLNIALSSADMGTWRTEIPSRSHEWDASLNQLLGFEAKSTQPQDPFLIIHEEDRDAVRSAISDAIRERRTFSHEFRVRRSDGQELWVSDQGRPCFDEQGKLCYFSGAMVDITERKRSEQARLELEKQLRHKHKMEAIGQLVAGVAHEFNNILVGILGNVDLILEGRRSGRVVGRAPGVESATGKEATADLEAASPPQGSSPTDSMDKSLQEVRRCGERAAALTRQLLTFAKKEHSSPTVFDMNDVLADSKGMLSRLLEAPVELAVKPSEQPLLVRADRGEMEQMLINLVINSRDAISGQGRIDVSLEAVRLDASDCSTRPELDGGEFARVRVQDDGCGMTEAVLERIFEPFFTTKPTGQGTGLGLSTVFSDVEKAGGHIDVKSRPEAGATFDVYLPQVLEEITLTPKAPDVSEDVGVETILIFDDEELVIDTLEAILNRQGYRVLRATVEEEAMAHVRREGATIDLLLTDVVMPGLSGPEFAERMRDLQPEMRVIFMSGYSTRTTEIDADGSAEFIQKPVGRVELLRHVRAVLDRVAPTSTLPDSHSTLPD